MSTNLYWKRITPSDGRLPIALKWHAEKEGNTHFLTLDFLYGFVINASDHEKEELQPLINALEEGVEVEFSIHG